MDLQIHKLTQSESDWIEKIGWILYDEDLSNGLSKEALHRIVDLIEEASESHSTNDIELEGAYQEGYDEGYTDAKNAYECTCDCD